MRVLPPVRVFTEVLAFAQGARFPLPLMDETHQLRKVS